MAPSLPPADTEDPVGESDGATARIAFRVPEQLKARIEEAATAEGRSVNAWLTRAASAALRAPVQTGTADPASSRRRSQQHFTGWVS